VDVAETQRLKSVQKSGIAVKYSCKAACDVRATLSIASSAARKLHLKAKLATAAATHGGPAQGTLKLKLSKATIKRLQKAKRVAATLDVTISNAAISESFSADVALRR
jgi:hypothetical protein